MGNLVFQATSGGQITLSGTNTASNYTIAVPAVTGTFVTTGDTGTVTNTMLANSSTTINGTAIALGASGTVTAAAGTLTGTTLASNVVSSSLTSVGTIATGVWNGTIITGTYGGTGINNGSNTISIAGNVTHSGAFTQTFTATGNTSVTLPTSGTLQTTTGSLASNTGLPISTGLSGLTTNGVAYATSTTALATGSALTYDGTYLTVGTSNASFKVGALGSNNFQIYNGALTQDGTNYAFAQNYTGVNTAINAASGGQILWQIAGSTKATFNSTGLGIGTVSPNVPLEVATASGGTIGLRYIGNSGYATIGTNANNEILFSIGNPPSSGEKMRIDSSGNLLVGTTDNGGTNTSGFELYIGASAARLYTGHATGTSSGVGYAVFNYNGSPIGSITQNGTTGVLYNLTSDYRLKNNPVALTGAKDFVMALQPKIWDWWDGSGKGVGFIAHEFMEVAKYSGHGEKDAIDKDGKPVYQSIQPSSSEIMANLVSLVQELTTKVMSLETKLGV